jgi:hypothetical protein
MLEKEGISAMNKISSTEAKTLLKTAAATIRTQKETIDELQTKVASFEKHERIEKVARAMEEKGLHAELTFEEKVAHLRQVQNLDVTEEAVKIASPQRGVFGSVSDKPSAGGAHPFETYILTGETPDPE